MIYELTPSQFPLAAPVFAPIDYNLSITSILAGSTSARVWVDDPLHPQAAFTPFKHHWFLSGQANNDFVQSLKQVIDETVIPEGKAAGRDIFLLHIGSEDWAPCADLLLAGLDVNRYRRSYLEATRLVGDWRGILPAGFEMVPVDLALTLQDGLENIDALHEEMCSERVSVEAFLEYSFGYAIETGSELAAWCLSEYNAAGRCEVGVATIEKYQHRGLGTAVSLALVEHALMHGYTRVGWHCWANNTASVALALRSGFEKVTDYPVYFIAL